MMKTLDEHNKQRIEQMSYPRHNGIACPECGEEMSDVGPDLLMSNPPKKRVDCFKCGLTDYAIA
jgi:hypothetical protein